MPASEQAVRRLSNVLGYPVEFFALGEPIYGPGTSEFFHRKRQAISVRMLTQLHAQVNIRRMHVSRLLRAVEIDSDHVPELDPDGFTGGASDVAKAVRGVGHA